MKKLLLFAFAVASLSACKKDSETTPSKTELLTAKSWRISAFTSTTTLTVTGSTPTVTSTKKDLYQSFPACEKDNFVKFNTNKTMVQDEGASTCSPGASQKENYTWDFNGDQTKLLVTPVGSTNTDTSELAELSATTLRIRNTSSSTSGNTKTDTVDEVTFTAF